MASAMPAATTVFIDGSGTEQRNVGHTVSAQDLYFVGAGAARRTIDFAGGMIAMGDVDHGVFVEGWEAAVLSDKVVLPPTSATLALMASGSPTVVTGESQNLIRNYPIPAKDGYVHLIDIRWPEESESTTQPDAPPGTSRSQSQEGSPLVVLIPGTGSTKESLDSDAENFVVNGFVVIQHHLRGHLPHNNTYAKTIADLENPDLKRGKAMNDMMESLDELEIVKGFISAFSATIPLNGKVGYTGASTGARVATACALRSGLPIPLDVSTTNLPNGAAAIGYEEGDTFLTIDSVAIRNYPPSIETPLLEYSKRFSVSDSGVHDFVVSAGKGLLGDDLYPVNLRDDATKLFFSGTTAMWTPGYKETFSALMIECSEEGDYTKVQDYLYQNWGYKYHGKFSSPWTLASSMDVPICVSNPFYDHWGPPDEWLKFIKLLPEGTDFHLRMGFYGHGAPKNREAKKAIRDMQIAWHERYLKGSSSFSSTFFPSGIEPFVNKYTTLEMPNDARVYRDTMRPLSEFSFTTWDVFPPPSVEVPEPLKFSDYRLVLRAHPVPAWWEPLYYFWGKHAGFDTPTSSPFGSIEASTLGMKWGKEEVRVDPPLKITFDPPPNSRWPQEEPGGSSQPGDPQTEYFRFKDYLDQARTGRYFLPDPSSLWQCPKRDATTGDCIPKLPVSPEWSFLHEAEVGPVQGGFIPMVQFPENPELSSTAEVMALVDQIKTFAINADASAPSHPEDYLYLREGCPQVKYQVIRHAGYGGVHYVSKPFKEDKRLSGPVKVRVGIDAINSGNDSSVSSQDPRVPRTFEVHAVLHDVSSEAFALYEDSWANHLPAAGQYKYWFRPADTKTDELITSVILRGNDCSGNLVSGNYTWDELAHLDFCQAPPPPEKPKCTCLEGAKQGYQSWLVTHYWDPIAIGQSYGGDLFARGYDKFPRYLHSATITAREFLNINFTRPKGKREPISYVDVEIPAVDWVFKEGRCLQIQIEGLSLRRPPYDKGYVDARPLSVPPFFLTRYPNEASDWWDQKREYYIQPRYPDRTPCSWVDISLSGASSELW